MSILPVYTALVLLICASLVFRAQSTSAIQVREARAIYGLFVALLIWVGLVGVLGARDTHVSLMQEIPLLWQAFVPMVIWMSAFAFSASVRQALWKIAEATPEPWLVLIQALRIGAIGGVVKGMRGEIASAYVFWIGIPDFIFGLSALVIAWLVRQQRIGARTIVLWNLLGFGIIVVPTFVPMNHWMKEPGFEFIFEFPMILAPSIVVSLLISLNLLHAWVAWKRNTRASVTT